MAYRESTKSLLRPNQVEEFTDEKNRLTGLLSAPPHISSQVQDRGAVRTQLRRLESQLENQTPKPYVEDKDVAVKRSSELEGDIKAGMPTQAEMRRNPAGAVDKHRAWEARNKSNILEYKNIQLRLHAGDDTRIKDETDVANIERLRPTGQELTGNEQIPGQIQFGPISTGAIIFTSSELSWLKKNDKILYEQLGLFSNEQRAVVRELVEEAMGE